MQTKTENTITLQKSKIQKQQKSTDIEELIEDSIDYVSVGCMKTALNLIINVTHMAK